jgi:hypothetical protein
MKSKNIYQKILLIASVIFLFLAIPDGWPYGFYQLVRWIVFLCGVYNTYKLGAKEKYFWASAFAFLAILYNPFAPIHFLKVTWQLIDFFAAIFVIFGYYKLRK